MNEPMAYDLGLHLTEVPINELTNPIEYRTGFYSNFHQSTSYYRRLKHELFPRHCDGYLFDKSFNQRNKAKGIQNLIDILYAVKF